MGVYYVKLLLGSSVNSCSDSGLHRMHTKAYVLHWERPGHSRPLCSRNTSALAAARADSQGQERQTSGQTHPIVLLDFE